MTDPPPKRRRIDAAQSTLRKPFRSPLKTKHESVTNASTPTPSKLRNVKSAEDLASSLGADPPTDPATESITNPNPPESADPSTEPSTEPTTNPTAREPANPSPSTTRTTLTPADKATIATLTTHLTSLRRRQSHLTADIDLLATTLPRLERAQDTELDALTAKWREATRVAAEEVWSHAREKVNGMGGVSAWRGRERERRRRVEEFSSGGWADEREDALLDGPDDESFTMGMMLRMMGIEFATVGYDDDRETWDDAP